MYASSARCLRPVASIASSGFPCRASCAGFTRPSRGSLRHFGSAGPRLRAKGGTFYFHLKPLLNEAFADEPEALAQLQRLLEVIILDELSHIGQRRNYLGAVAIRVARRLLSPMIRSYFADILESKLLFNIDKMVQDARQFDYNLLSPRILERIWIPSYILAARSG
jgi:hypothetical protein